jgi:uncharacterized coiled-coil DUF342 family protein
MNNDSPQPTQPVKEKFRPEGSGYTLSMLDASYSPVYYGFNCRPRQVKYHKVMKSVEDVLEGKTSKSVALAFFDKVKKMQEKHNATLQKYKDEIESLNAKSNEEGREYYSRKYFRDEIEKIENKLYSDNNYCKERDLVKAIKDLGEYINS